MPRSATNIGALGVVVPHLQSGGCRFESRPGLLRTKVYSAFHPSWLIPMADERVGVQVKL